MKNLFFIALLILFLAPHTSTAQILIFTTAYNRPDFIEMQYKTFKKFLKNDYTFMVFNDAEDSAKERAIRKTCARLNIECVRIPQHLHTTDLKGTARAGSRHGEAVHFAFEHRGFKHDDIVVLLDSDEFLLHDWDIREFLGDADIYVLNEYIKPQLAIMNMPHLPNVETINFHPKYNPSKKIFADTGQQTQSYLLAHQELKLKQGTMVWGLYGNHPNPALLNVDEQVATGAHLKKMGYTDSEIKLIEDIVNLSVSTNNFTAANIGFYEKNLFLDYQHGSGWGNPNPFVVAKKDKIIKDFIDSIVA